MKDQKGRLVFFRCELCHRVVSEWDIKKGCCQHCSGSRIRPTELTFLEKIVQVIKHPNIWGWKNVG